MEALVSKEESIKEIVSAGQLLLVQVTKEAISTKGPRLTGEISLAGRFLILMPFSNQINVSQKITHNEERTRLRKAMTKIKPQNMGLVIRTNAKDQPMEALHADMRNLLEKWHEMVQNISGMTFPKRVISELDRTSAFMRDLLNESFDSIQINDTARYEEIRAYVQTIAPDKADIVKLYKGKAPLFEHFEIDRQIRGAFGKNISLKGGTYLVIEHTEALHVIDVNSGHRLSEEKTQDVNIMEVNMRAAVEVARQLRLRDMGGIIIVDFIDMRLTAHRKDLFNCITEEMQKDKARHTILPPNRFGLIQITRHRVRPEINIDVTERCPSCNGTGLVRPPILIVESIENDLQLLIHTQKEHKLTIAVHPFLFSYFRRKRIRLKWWWQHKIWVKIQERADFHLLEYKFYSQEHGEINFWAPERKTADCITEGKKPENDSD
jgi:ribonuclease G